MPPDIAARLRSGPGLLADLPDVWRAALLRLGAVWAGSLVLFLQDWRDMADQWWNISTYNHVLLVPVIIVWLVRERLPQLAQVTLDEVLRTDAMLMGRRTYEWFAGRWPSRTGALADRLNSIPKYIVSSTLQDPEWNNARVIKGDLLDEVSKLRRLVSGDVVISASYRIARTLVENDLVDELRLKVFPVVLGAGDRLFGETSARRPMRLVDVRTLDGDTAYLTYERAGPRPIGEG